MPKPPSPGPLRSLTKETLLSNGPPPPILVNPYDALAAAVLDDQKLLVTSPNSTSIPLPPLGSQRDVVLRENGYYGLVDYLQWPQPYNPDFPHLSVVPLAPDYEFTPDNLYLPYPQMFEPLSQADIVCHQGNDQLQIITRSLALHFERACAFAYQRAQRAKDEVSSLLGNQSEVARALRHPALLRHLLQVSFTHICNVPSVPQILRCGHREMQRAWLTLVAWADWHLVFTQPSQDRAIAHVRGCFTNSPQVLHTMFNAGVPVFYIYPESSFAIQRVKSVVDFQKPEAAIEGPACRGHLTIHRGPANSAGAVTAILRSALSVFDNTDAFANGHYPGAYISSWTPNTSVTAIASSSSCNSPTSSTPGPLRSERSNKHADKKPYRSSKPPKPVMSIRIPENHRNVFQEPSGLNCIPPADPVWFGINETIEVYGDPGRMTSLFPNPGLFIGSKNPIALIKHWADFKAVWINHCTVYCREQAELTPKQWRKLLGWQTAKSWTASEVPASKEQEEYKAMYFLARQCYAESKVEESISAQNLLTDDQSRLILWELYELNFRYELSQLDILADSTAPQSKAHETKEAFASACSLHRSRRRVLIGKCFPPSPLFRVDPSQASTEGLTATEWKNSYQYFKALWLVMDSWAGKKPAQWASNSHDQLRTAPAGVRHTWARGIAEFYAKTFYRFLKRPPVLPRRESDRYALFSGPVYPVTARSVV